MSNNGQGRKSVLSEAFDLLDDQIELASLEWQYEKNQSLKSVSRIAVAGILAVTAFALLQIALVYGLSLLGLSTAQAALLLAIVYGLGAFILLRNLGRRDPRVGEPFQGSRQELRKNLKWIHQFFS